MLFSIIIPVYNVEAYLARAVDSAIGQDCNEPFEIILIDDGSRDASGRICDEYARKDSRIKVIHKSNGGLSSARNAGLDVCVGEYVVFLDSDDWLERDLLTRVKEVILSNRVDLLGFFSRDARSDGSVVERKKNYLFGRVLEAGEFLNFDWLDSSVWAYAWKREFIEKGKMRFVEGIFLEDMLFTNQAMCFVKTCWFLDYFGYNYFQRADSIMNKSSLAHVKKRLNDYCFVVEKLRDLLLFFNGDPLRVKRLKNEINTQVYQIFFSLLFDHLPYLEAKKIFGRLKSQKFIPLPKKIGKRSYPFFRFLTQIRCPLWVLRPIQRAITVINAFRGRIPNRRSESKT
jgi:glycosyltransferase involved in cell wall biosynthesis